MSTRIRRALTVAVVAVLAVAGIVVTATPASAVGGTITGTVRQNSAPIAGATLGLGTWNGTSWDFPGTYAETNGSGVYSFSGLAAGTYTTYVERSGSWAATWAGGQAFIADAQHLTINGNTVTADINQILGGTFTVYVVQGTGQANSPGAHVNFCHYADNGAECGNGGITDSTGTFTTGAIAPGTWQATVEKAGYPGEYYNDWALDGSATGPFDEVRVYPGSNAAAAFWLRTDKLPGTTYFQDVPQASTYWSAVQYVATNGISTGTPQFLERPLYKPLDPVSRQAMAQFLYRLSGSTFVPGSTPHFADVSTSNAFYGAIEWMYSTGLSTGTPQGGGLKPLFKPSDSVSRQALASFLYRLSAETFSPPGTASFADVPTSSAYFTAIEWMKAKNISTGTAQPSGLPLFKPLDPVSRQAMAVFLQRYVEGPGGGT